MKRALMFAAVLGACAGGGAPSGSSARPRGVGRPIDDRIVVPSMTVIRAVAASDRYVFAAAAGGLGIYEPRTNEWRRPFTVVDGWPASEVTVMMADPADPEAVWFASESFVFHYRVGDDRAIRSSVPSPVVAGAFFVDGNDPAGGVIVGGAAGLVRVSPTGFVGAYTPSTIPPRPGIPSRGRITPPSLAAIYAQYRSLRDFERLLTQDSELRVWPVTSGASSPTASEVWLGTAGGGLFKVDPLFNRGTQLPFGLIGDGAGAVARGPDGVWIGGLSIGVNPRGGITYTDNDLRQWRWYEGGGARSVFSGVNTIALSSYGSALWAATDRGLVQLDAQTGGVMSRWDDASGLPSALVLAVEATEGGAWIGTSRGLAFVHNATRSGTGRAADVDSLRLQGQPIRALTRRGDSLWIGSEIGVLVFAPGNAEPRRLRLANNDSRLNQSVTAIATADSVVVIANANGEIVRLSTRTGAPSDTVLFVNAARVGRINALAIDATTVWIAGQGGVMAVRRDSKLERFLPVGTDLPSEAYGVAINPSFAWIATRAGIVRLRRFDDGLPR